MFNREERYSEVKCNGDREMTIGHCIWQHGDHCELTKSTSNAEARRGVTEGDRERPEELLGVSACGKKQDWRFHFPLSGLQKSSLSKF